MRKIFPRCFSARSSPRPQQGIKGEFLGDFRHLAGNARGLSAPTLVKHQSVRQDACKYSQTKYCKKDINCS